MPPEANQALATVDASQRRSGLCLLLVEDNEADAYLITRTLADHPDVAKVVRVRDGVEALAAFERGEVSPDLAFIDLHMPRMNGFDLLVALTSRGDASFPMVVLTSSAAPSDAIRSRLRNANRVVTKPDTVTELYAVLATAIDAVCPPGARTTSAKPCKTPDYLLMAPPAPGVRRTVAAGEIG